MRPLLDEAETEQLKAILHRSPRDFGKKTSLWTLDLLADVLFAQRVTPRRVSREYVCQTLKRMGIVWKRARHRITSPDPAYEVKKRPRPADPSGAREPGMGSRFPGRNLMGSFRAAARVGLVGGGASSCIW